MCVPACRGVLTGPYTLLASGLWASPDASNWEDWDPGTASGQAEPSYQRKTCRRRANIFPIMGLHTAQPEKGMR